MTVHALERLAQRFPDIAPEDAMTQIAAAMRSGKAKHVADSIADGKAVYAVILKGGALCFPVMSKGGAVITVLIEGMDFETPTGRITLERPGLPYGVHQLDEAAYHADPAKVPSLSSTLARKLLSQSPLHAWTDHPRLNPNWQPTIKTTFDIGTAAHAAILGRGAGWCVYPPEVLGANGAASTKAAKEFAEETRAQGMVPLKQDQEDGILAMKAKMAEMLLEYQIDLDPACSEVVALAEVDGVPCRTMIDNAPLDPRQPLYDLKTCESAAPDACMKAVMNYGYDVQARHYLDTWKAATGHDRAFQFIFQEKSAPFEACVVELSQDSLEMAGRKITRAREIWRNCVQSDYWPGYPRGVHQIALPEFFHGKWLEQESVIKDFRQQTGRDILDFAHRWQAPENHKLAGE